MKILNVFHEDILHPMIWKWN